MDASITVRLLDETRSGFSNIQRNLTSVDNTSQKLQRTMGNLATAATAFVGALGAREVFQFINTIQNLDNRLKLVTGSTAQLEQKYQQLFDIAQKTRTPIGENIDLYSKLAQNLRVVGQDADGVSKVVEAFNIALAVSGTSGNAAAGAITQFAQALQSGKFQGDEFRSISEAVPKVLAVISEKTGIAREDLKKFASEGLLNAKVVTQALVEALPELQKELGTTSVTVGQALTQMQNEFSRLGREFLSATGAGDEIVKVFQHITKNSENIIEIIKVLGAAITAVVAIFNPWKVVIGLVTAGIIALADELGPIAKVINDILGRALDYVIKKLTGFGAAIKALINFENPFTAYVKAVEEYDKRAAEATKTTKALEKETGALGKTTNQLTKETKAGNQVSAEMKKRLDEAGVTAKKTKDAYSDFIKELREEVEVSRLDSREKQIQQTVYKALAAEAKKFGGDLSKISATRRAEIEAEVRALAGQLEDEKAAAAERKRIADDLKRKQEEYDRFIQDSRTSNLQGLQLFIQQQEQAEKEYRDGQFRDEEQFQKYMAALKQRYQQDNANRAADFIKSQLSAEENYARERLRLTKEYQEGLIADEETYNVLLESIRVKYGKKFDDMAKKQREDELTATQQYHKDLQELDTAYGNGLIKNQEDYLTIRRKLEQDYRDETVREYNNLYGFLNDKLMELTGVTQKEFGIINDVMKLAFGVDVEDVIKGFFAAGIRYMVGFRDETTTNMFSVQGVISSIFGQQGEPLTQIAGFGVTGLGHITGFGDQSKSVFGSIGNIIGDVFTGGLDFIGAFVKGGLELLMGFGKGAGGIFGQIGDWISKIFSSGGGGGGGFWDTVLDIGGSVLDFGGDIFGGIGDVIGSIGGGIGDVVGGISDALGLGDIVGGIGDVLGSIGGGIGDVLGSIPGVGDILGGIGDVVGSIPGVGDILGSIGGGITDLVGSIPIVGDIVGGIGSALGLSGAGSALGGLSSFLGPVGLLAGLFSLGGMFGDKEKAKKKQDAATNQWRKDFAKTQDDVRNFQTEFNKVIGIQSSMSTPGAYDLVDRKTGQILETRKFNLPAITKEYGQGFGQTFGLQSYIASGDTKYGAKGLAFNRGNITEYAMGGILNRPTMFTTNDGLAIGGEAGTEAILPLKRGRDGRLGVAGVTGDININFTVNAMDAKDFDTLLIEKKQLITNIVSNAVRQGRSFA